MSDSLRPAADDSAAKVRGRLLVLAAAVMWSTSGFFAQAPWFDSWPAEVNHWPHRGLRLAFWRALFAGLLLAIFVRRPRWDWRLVPMTVIFVVMNVTFMSAMVMTTAANAIWLQNTAPAWIFLASVFLLGDPVRRADWMVLAFAGMGVSFILWFELQAGDAVGVSWAVGSGITYAGVVVCLRWLRSEDAAWLVALNHLVTAAALSPYAFTQAQLPSLFQLVILAAFGMLQMGLPYLLFAHGLRHISGHEASGIVLLEPILVPVWVALAWQHYPAWWTLVGGAFILIGLVLRYVVTTRRRGAAHPNPKR